MHAVVVAGHASHDGVGFKAVVAGEIQAVEGILDLGLGNSAIQFVELGGHVLTRRLGLLLLLRLLLFLLL